MASYKSHCIQFLYKRVKCFFVLNQMCQSDPLVVLNKQYVTQCSSYNSSFLKIHSSESLLNKIKTPSRGFQIRPRFQVPSHSKHSPLSPLNRVNGGLGTAFLLINSLSSCAGHLSTQSIQRMSTKANTPASHMVWVDCEMTGLDVQKDSILEIAMIITDADLNVVDQTEIVVNKPDEVLQSMNEWCIVHHNASGLTDRVRASTVSTEQADEMLTQFVSKYVAPKTAPLIGNSIYMDRMFIIREFPRFNEYLHYRIVDVSSLKELCKTYNPDLYQKIPKKRMLHRGLQDIEDTLAEFKFYKKYFLKTPNNAAEFPTAVPYC